MINYDNDQVHFDICSTDVEESIALLSDMKDYCQTLNDENGHRETCKALTTAIEVMQAFWCEKFGDGEKVSEEVSDYDRKGN